MTLAFLKEIFEIQTPRQFEESALKLFQFQYSENPVYHEYATALKINPNKVVSLENIPFLPIDFFKTRRVVCENRQPQAVFGSSGTSGMDRSRHEVPELSVYDNSFLKSFNMFFGDPADFVFLALLPSYLERTDSSLVYMVQKLAAVGNHPENGFYLDNFSALHETLLSIEAQKKPAVLFGVTFALIDFFQRFPIRLKYTRIIETGGMKGRKKEITRPELHDILCDATGLQAIGSEYGMTELLSQAWSLGGDRYHCPPWMRVLIRDVNDPFAYIPTDKTGGINIIDLANVYSCAFIETKDLGKRHHAGTFEVSGRFDHADIRGCNLLAL